ncbi:hypothetical protein [Atopobacter phocae]|uniref:hypothetical protein n=1 Tax=Atopobacter phocae TaxID=136492 RepID=UPI000471A9EF|nr:hypothetical protein [Atopobacter phocae]
MAQKQMKKANQPFVWLKRGTLALIIINGISIIGTLYSLFQSFFPKTEPGIPYANAMLVDAQASGYNRLTLILSLIVTVALFVLYIEANQRMKEEDLPSSFVYWADIVTCVLSFFSMWHLNASYAGLDAWNALNAPLVVAIISIAFLAGMLYFRKQASQVITYVPTEDEVKWKERFTRLKSKVMGRKKVKRKVVPRGSRALKQKGGQK